MRTFLAAVLLMFTLPSFADSYIDLYQAGGWPQQRAHFRDALSGAQQRYRNSLPPTIYQALVDNSNQRFTAAGIDQRALAGLRQLSDPQPALRFFQSPLGRKIINAEVLATQREQLAQYANGVPRSQAGATRRQLVGELSQALPAKEAGAEVSLALASVAADSLSQMLPGLLGGGQAQAMLDNQRQRLMEQIGNDLDNSLLFVYRELSEPELQAFVNFAQSNDGKAYYQAALAALRAGLAVGQSSASLAP